MNQRIRYTISKCASIPKRKKNGEFGKSYTHYVLNGKEYKTKQELLDAINNTDYGKTKESGGNAANDV